jgi:hypothetical protein
MLPCQRQAIYSPSLAAASRQIFLPYRIPVLTVSSHSVIISEHVTFRLGRRG